MQRAMAWQEALQQLDALLAGANATSTLQLVQTAAAFLRAVHTAPSGSSAENFAAISRCATPA